MKTFAIDNENNITAYAMPEQVPEGHARFSGKKELAKISAKWPASRMVEIRNTLPGATPVKKFTERKTAVIRILKAIQSLEPAPPPEPPAPEPPEQEPPAQPASPEPAAPETAPTETAQPAASWDRSR